MRTTTLLAAAAALTIGAMLAGFGLAHSQQLATGSNALGSGGAALGRRDVPLVEDQRAVAPAALGDCVANRIAFRTQTNNVSTSSPSFVPMPNTHFPVTTSGGCLIVDFSAELTTTVNTSAQVRALIAEIGAAQPPAAFMERNDNPEVPFRARSMRFVFPNVPAGQHVVRIEFRSGDGGMVLAGVRTLTVQYRP